ncbi:FAD-dependent oxidoreductase [Telmatobacter sp. DSM 110680]|uniref:FAD-dependent oxidoreductase n=1 Tax=Telmatobacter sp. DSM 110680 TaxID=3036704 RepID=A0AAU7DLU1_9BACT
MQTSFDAVIVGGGIVGAATAASCARAGLQVALVERDMLGGGATAAGMGHVVVMDDSEAQFALTRYSQLLWSRLAAQLPDSVEYETTGTIWLAADDEEMAEAERKHRFYCDRDVPAQLLNARELFDLEPNVRPGLAGALLVPEDAVIYPPTAALHFAKVAEHLGATLVIGRSVTQMGSGRVVLDCGAELTARCLINATGTCAPELTRDVPVKKRKGHLVITDRYLGFVRHQLVELGYLKSAHSVSSNSVAFNVQPRKTGQILIGSSRQYGDETSNVDQEILSAMLQRAATYMPSIGDLNALRVWTGFRAATPDKLPLIGPASFDETVWLATGHEGLGITTSLATGELLAAKLTGRESAIPIEPYVPSRFVKPDNQDVASHKEPLCNGKA